MKAIVLLLLLWAANPTQKEYLRCPCQQQAGDHKQNPNNIAAGADSDCEQTNYSSATTNTQQKPRDWLETLYLLSGPIVGVLAILTAWLVGRQIKSQRDAERPWLIVSRADLIGEEFGKDILSACWKFKNTGKSPAFNVSVLTGLIVVDDRDNLPQLEYRKSEQFHDLAPVSIGEESMPIDARIDAPIRDAFNAAQYDGKHIVIFGKIFYSDAFARKHESRFCYSYDFRRKMYATFSYMCGGKKYNKYT